MSLGGSKLSQLNLLDVLVCSTSIFVAKFALVVMLSRTLPRLECRQRRGDELGGAFFDEGSHLKVMFLRPFQAVLVTHVRPAVRCFLMGF